MKNVRLSTLVVLLGAAGIPACSGSSGKVNIGNTAVIGSQLSDYAATWDGYAEAYTFTPDGSDRVRLTIGTDGQGTLEVGNTALWPAPTDPNVGYPPGESSAEPMAPHSNQLSEGFLYPVYAAQVQADRIQVGVNPGDLYSAWCALLTPSVSYETTVTPDGGAPMQVSGIVDGGVVTPYYRCLPNVPASYTPGVGCALMNPDQTTTPVDCGKYALCNMAMVCQCAASGCTSNQIAAGTPVAQYPIELDGALDATGTMLTGTLTLGGGVTIHLTKQ